MPQAKECDRYIIDTCRTETGWIAGALTYYGRKRLDAIQWKDKPFATEGQANHFVRAYFAGRNVSEAENEGALQMHSTWRRAA